MKPLARPSWDSLRDFDAIVTSKHGDKELLREVRSAIESSYARYRACAPALENFGRAFLAEGPRRALLSCYAANLRTKACKKMLAGLARLNPELRKCPLCGINEPSTWDHYLPQSEFPELAVCAYNLVRACGVCNTGRNDEWSGLQGRLLLHMYYDWIRQDMRLLDVGISIEHRGIQVRYALRSSVDDPGFAGQFARHCMTLDLLPRFEKVALDELVERVPSLGRFCIDAEAVRAHLRSEECELARLRGVNHWKTALYRGAADSDAFIAYALRRPER